MYYTISFTRVFLNAFICPDLTIYANKVEKHAFNLCSTSNFYLLCVSQVGHLYSYTNSEYYLCAFLWHHILFLSYLCGVSGSGRALRDGLYFQWLPPDTLSWMLKVIHIHERVLGSCDFSICYSGKSTQPKDRSIHAYYFQHTRSGRVCRPLLVCI